MWDIWFDGDESQSLPYLRALATTEAVHWCHLSRFLVAEIDDQSVAALSGYFPEEHGNDALAKGIQEADAQVGRTPDETAASLKRISPIHHVTASHEPGAWVVENVATKPEHRRRGLIDALLPQILQRGVDLGATHFDVGVFIGNEAAQRAYEKAGFRVVGEKRHPEFERVYGCPGTRRLSRSI